MSIQTTQHSYMRQLSSNRMALTIKPHPVTKVKATDPGQERTIQQKKVHKAGNV